MSEEEAVEILIRNGTSVFDNKTIDESFTDLDNADPEELTQYNEAVDYLVTECYYEFAKN